MKKTDYIDTTFLKKEYALSCIENYLLVILSQSMNVGRVFFLKVL